MRAIPSNFVAILFALKRSLPRGSCSPDARDRLALALADEIMAAVKRPRGRVLCACNDAWIPCKGRKPVTVGGHGYDDCDAPRQKGD